MATHPQGGVDEGPADSDLRMLGLVGSRFIDVCRRTADHQWGWSTPCPEWTLDQLVDHVTGGNRFTVRILNGDSVEAAMAATMASFSQGQDPRSGAMSSMAALEQAFGLPGALDHVCQHVAGELTGRQVLRLRLHDLIVHTWDIGQVVGLHDQLPEELVQWGLAEIAEPDSLTARHFDIERGTTTTPAGEPPEWAYLATFGRSAPHTAQEGPTPS